MWEFLVLGGKDKMRRGIPEEIKNTEEALS